ncbi:DUF4190 domain-containing protein [Streptomyces formicae]|uniref:DUF4190 and DUF4352 domain-containing protein n=1 Tax=Streptomyces formicae TaxID=1616117 RepID=A0ABY3WSI9_9ACTN|nr:DUF4190 domain-containing protein [Streptomyces formicae]UNM15587.1 DUF4190 and DUF4352 domain-containing protein [Streptomyces formicae]
MSQYTQQPPYAPEPPVPHSPAPHPAARNGLGTAALILGIIGALSGVIPFFFWLAGILGLIGLILGFSARGRVKRGEATNKGVALAGVILGLVSLVLSVVGAVITFKAVGDAVDEINKATSGSSASKRPGAGSDKPLEKAEGGEDATGKALAAGDSAVYDDELTVTVSEPKPYTPGEVAAGHTKGNKAYQVTVTIENAGKEKFDASLVTAEARAGKDGVSAEEIYDDKVGEPITGTVLPGKKVTTTWAFDTPAGAANLTIEISPGFEYNASVWDLKL